MSLPLWTPYVHCEAVDLSKTHIKQEPVSPPSDEQQSPYDQHSPDYTSSFSAAASPWQYLSYLEPCYVLNQDAIQSQQDQSRYAQYQCAESTSTTQVYRYPIPASQISPTSGGNCSRCVDAVYRQPAMLSPPESPPAEKLLKADTLENDEEFLAFERNAMRAMALKNGGSLLGNNPRMRRTVQSTNQNAADDAYKTQRRRNNIAAKQSRDRRKLREIHLALKVTYLTNTVAKLTAQLAGRYCGGCQQPLGSPK